MHRADGEVAALFPTGHAVGLNTKDGMELLLHIGINTVEMQGDGFKIHTKQGAKVKAGELLVEFVLPRLKRQALMQPLWFSYPMHR